MAAASAATPGQRCDRAQQLTPTSATRPYVPLCSLDGYVGMGHYAPVLLAVRTLARVGLTVALVGVAGCSTDNGAPVSRVAPADVPADLAGQVSKYVYNDEPGAGSFTIIGLPGSSPFGHKDAVIEINDHSTAAIQAGDTIRGGVAAAVAETSIPGGTSRSVAWNEDGTTLVTARSSTLDISELKALVEDLTISNDHAIHSSRSTPIRCKAAGNRRQGRWNLPQV
jgi:hypothetical protein